MGNHDQLKYFKSEVKAFDGMSDETQCEKIADQYEKISKLYEP